MSVGTPTVRPRTWRSRLPSLLRTVHLYLSVGASLCIGFFALTGLIANLRDEESSDHAEQVPPTALGSTLALATHLQAAFALAAPPTIEEIGPDLFTATADQGEERLDIAVYRSTATMQVTRWRPLPADVALDRDALMVWCSARFPGAPEVGDEADDPERDDVQVRISSVWKTWSITVLRGERRWGVSETAHGVAKALADLHTGRNATVAQRLLMDAVAIALLLSVVTGIILGLAWIAKPRRRRITALILFGGLLCLYALIAGR